MDNKVNNKDSHDEYRIQQFPPTGPSRPGQGPGQRPPTGPSRPGQGPGQRPPVGLGPGPRPPVGPGPGQRPPVGPGPGPGPRPPVGPGQRPPTGPGPVIPPGMQQPRSAPPNFIPLGPSGRGAAPQMGQYRERHRGNMQSSQREFFGCMNRFTYLWLVNGNNFWFFPILIDRRFVIGFRWRNNRWEFDRINLNRIFFFSCF